MQIIKTATLTGHTGSVYTLLSGNAPAIFYSGSGDGMVIRWNLNDLTSGTIAAKVHANIFSLCTIPQNNLLLIGQMQGGINVVNLAEKKDIRHLASHQNGVYDIQRKPGEKHLL